MTRESGRQTRHSFSFGPFHDLERMGFGPLIALNDDLLGPGIGYDAHEHADVTIVTWVVLGALRHTDDTGTSIQAAGTLSVTRAGAGLTHSEVADGVPTRFVQAWLRPDQPGGPPCRVVLTPDPTDGLAEVGLPDLGVAGARLRLGTLAPGETVPLPHSPLVHTFVVTGALARSSLAQPLSAGDAFEIVGEGGLSVTATVPTRLLVWSFG